MGISILTEEQFNSWIRYARPNIHSSVGHSIWIDSLELFTGVVLAFSYEDYVKSPSFRNYYSSGKLIGQDPESWMERLSQQDQTEALFRLDEWREKVWGKEIDLDFLCDQQFQLFLPKENSCLNNFFKLNDRIFQVLEDEEDGYRSRMDKVIELNTSLDGFSEKPITIELRKNQINQTNKFSDGDFEGYVLVDVRTDHIWLRFGTDNCRDYYPYFTFIISEPKTK